MLYIYGKNFRLMEALIKRFEAAKKKESQETGDNMSLIEFMSISSLLNTTLFIFCCLSPE